MRRAVWRSLPHFTGARIALNEFPDKAIPVSAVPESRVWPSEGLTRVPYWIYQDEDIYARGGFARSSRRSTLFREPLRAPRRAPVPEKPRQHEGDYLHLSQLDL